MAQVTVKLNESDLVALRRKLDTLTPAVLEHVVKDAAPYIRDQAKAGAPVQTGALAMSLVAEVSGLQARIHSPIEYALPQEFGRHGGRGKAGRFFLRRALQMLLQTELPRLFKKSISDLESAWARR